MGQLKPNQILNKAYRQVAIETEHIRWSKRRNPKGTLKEFPK